MANTSVFQSVFQKQMVPDTVNAAGGAAYARTDEAKLASYAMLGTFNDTYYVGAAQQLTECLELAKSVDELFVAKLAVYARTHGHMKDMPAFLMAVLAARNSKWLGPAWPLVIDNAKMLRNFAQIVRSGVTGRKSFGTHPRAHIREWFQSRSPETIFWQSTGNSPSMADVIKMVHPKPRDLKDNALFGWILGKKYDELALPEKVQAFERFKRDGGDLPNVPFEMLTALPLTEGDWTKIAINATWSQLRQNLNAFQRHGVFKDNAVVKRLSEKLSNREAIKKAKAFPYQLLTTYQNTPKIPQLLSEALQDAMEVATENVPRLDGKVFICVDVSGSMISPVTGNRSTASTKTRCVDVAALAAASILRVSPHAMILPFERDVVGIQLNIRDSVMTNARILASIGGGGTDCAAPLWVLNENKADVDLVVFLSDNESGAHKQIYNSGRGTYMANEWVRIKRRCPEARMACFDIQSNTSAQIPTRLIDTMNFGGFSDTMFTVLSQFAKGEIDGEALVKHVHKVVL